MGEDKIWFMAVGGGKSRSSYRKQITNVRFRQGRVGGQLWVYIIPSGQRILGHFNMEKKVVILIYLQNQLDLKLVALDNFLLPSHQLCHIPGGTQIASSQPKLFFLS